MVFRPKHADPPEPEDLNEACKIMHIVRTGGGRPLEDFSDTTAGAVLYAVHVTTEKDRSDIETNQKMFIEMCKAAGMGSAMGSVFGGR